MTQVSEPRWTLVVGGSRGLGAACARHIAQGGQPVVVTYRLDLRAAKAVEHDIRAAGAPWSRVAEMELNDPKQCESRIESLMDDLGPPGAVVLSAAQLLQASLRDTPVDDFAAQLTCNCTSPYAIARTCGLAMRAAGSGSITMLSSVIGPFGVHDRVAYATSKAGLIGMTKALAVELAPQVRVNAVVLGTFATDITARLQEDRPALRALESRVPLGRLGTADEAAVVVALLAQQAHFVTGAVWEVDGGTSARLATPSGDPDLGRD